MLYTHAAVSSRLGVGLALERVTRTSILTAVAGVLCSLARHAYETGMEATTGTTTAQQLARALASTSGFSVDTVLYLHSYLKSAGKSAHTPLAFT